MSVVSSRSGRFGFFNCLHLFGQETTPESQSSGETAPFSEFPTLGLSSYLYILKISSTYPNMPSLNI
jgi:hypothetical protein